MTVPCSTVRTGAPIIDRWAHLSLMPDARVALQQLDAVLTAPFHSLGVEEARTIVAGLRPSIGDSIHAVEDFEIPGTHGPIPVRLYRPTDGPGLPVLLYFHGGGWTLGSTDGVDACCRRLARLSDCAVLSVEYRLAPEHKFPIPLDDCFDALTWVAQHGSTRGVDGTTVAVAGDSAGGNLAIAVCLRARDFGGPAIVMQVLAYPAFARPEHFSSFIEYADAPVLTARDCEWFLSNYVRGDADYADPYAIPAAASTLAGLPPAFVVSAEIDPLRDCAEDYARRLIATGVAAELRRYDGVCHGFFTEVGTLTAADAAVAEAASRVRRAFDAQRERAP